MRRVSTLLILLVFIGLSAQAQFNSNSFSAKVDFSTGTNIQSLVTGDLNGDGKVEMVTGNINSSTLTVFVNNTAPGVINSGTYATSFTLATISVSGATPSVVTMADLNGDNKNEIICGYSGSTHTVFSVFLNQYTSGTFSASSFSRLDYTGGSTPNGVAAADFDGDGKKDIVVTNYSSGGASVYRNTSSLSTISFAAAVTHTVGSQPGTVATGDIDNDGKIDFAVSNWGSNSISVYRNTSIGVGYISFSVVNAINTATTLSNPNWVSITDLDNNGKKEVMVSNWGSSSMSIFQNTATSGISFASRVDISSTSSYPQYNSNADFDGDGKSDIMLAIAANPIVACYRNVHTTGLLTASSFSTQVNYTVGTSPVGGYVGDVDNDLRPDILIGNYSSQSVSVLKNRCLASEPTVSGGSISGMVTGNSVVLNFAKGNGQRRIVIGRSNSSTAFQPQDTAFYSANSQFGSGSDIGNNNYVVYSDTGSTVTVTGLSFGSIYVFEVFEYNGVGGYSNYYTSSSGSTGGLAIGNIFYSKSSGELNNVATWGANPDGSGASPISFNATNTIYRIVNNPAPTLTANWIVSGTGSFVEIGNGSNALNFTIPSGSSIFTDSLSVRSYATLTFTGGLVCNKVYFDSLSTAQFTNSTVQSIPGFTYYNLIAAGGVKNLSNNCNVKGSLNLLTSVNTGSYLLTLGTSATQPGVLNRNASGAIVGRFRRWFAASANTGNTGLFPMATSTLYYRPAQIDFTSAPTAGGTLTTEFIATPPGNSGLPLYDFSNGFVEVNKASVNGYWKIDASGITGGTYTVTLTGTGFLGVNVVADLRILKRSTAGAWFLQGTAITGTGTTSVPVAGRSGMSGFGEYTLAGDSTVNPLPVTWLDVKAQYEEEYASVNWATAREINNDRFEIEKAEGPSKDFVFIGKVMPMGNSGVQQYSFEDKDVNKHLTNLYRIKQVDKDGKFSYSKTVILEPQFAEELTVYPNPGTGFIQLSGKEMASQVRVISAQGSLVLETAINSNKLDLSQLKPGVYMMEFYYKDGTMRYARYLKE